MSRRHVFASLAAGSDRCYVYDTESFFNGRAPVEEHFRYYRTYGDGSTAHTPDCAITVEMLPDYLMSLAAAALANRQLAQDAFYAFAEPSAAEIAFAAGIKHDSNGKVRFYSLEERKVTTSPAKRHDRRYEEVPTYADGSPDSVGRLLYHDWHSPFRTYCIAETVRDWFARTQEVYAELPARVFGSRGNDWSRIDANDCHAAYDAAINAIRMERTRSLVETRIANYESRLRARTEAA